MATAVSTHLATTRRATVAARERGVFLAATGLVALHIVDVELVQPRPGTTAADHLAAALVALSFGALSLVAAGIAAGGGVSGSDVSGLGLVPAAAAFLALGLYAPWH